MRRHPSSVPPPVLPVQPSLLKVIHYIERETSRQQSRSFQSLLLVFTTCNTSRRCPSWYFSHGVVTNPFARVYLGAEVAFHTSPVPCNDECSENDPRLANSIQFRNVAVKNLPNYDDRRQNQAAIAEVIKSLLSESRFETVLTTARIDFTGRPVLSEVRMWMTLAFTRNYRGPEHTPSSTIQATGNGS